VFKDGLFIHIVHATHRSKAGQSLLKRSEKFVHDAGELRLVLESGAELQPSVAVSRWSIA
jgi:hypothetical protein